MVIRPIKESHVSEVAAVQFESWKTAFKGILSDKLLEQLRLENFEKVWRDILNRKHRTNLLIEEGKRIVGFVSFEENTDGIPARTDGELIGIYVHPSYWRLGAGSALLKQSLKHMKKNHFQKVFLWTMKDNVISREFFEKTGFRISGQQRHSERHGEHFAELRYEMILPEIVEEKPFVVP